MAKLKSTGNVPIEEKLKNLFELQQVDSKIDEIQRMKGELPMEVADLEDELVGLQTRIDKLQAEKHELEIKLAKHNNQILEAESLIARYEHQQTNVKNNREFEALNKEIEFQRLDIQLAQKRILECRRAIAGKDQTLETAMRKHEQRARELESKEEELKKIIARTERDEQTLVRRVEKARKKIEERLLRAYDRVRGAYRNGLAVVSVERGSCGGCHNYVPPQTQLEIRQRKKFIFCEHCGRMLIDQYIHAPRNEDGSPAIDPNAQAEAPSFYDSGFSRYDEGLDESF